MKNLKVLLLALFIAPAFLTISGCGDDSTPPAATDTTDNGGGVTILNSFDLGNFRYEIVTNDALTDATYNSQTDQTIVTVTGTSTKKSGTNIADGDVVIQIKFPGKVVAKFEQERMQPVELEIAIKENNKPEIAYATADDSKVVVNLIEYGEVGKTVKGTFSGTLKSGSSAIVKNGLFEVIRDADR